ncbi:MAG: FtsK/SpoIIIE domain-containing protein [Planctomycetota bacterium]|nr:FtsK/SpoIIIE domain-containing protein [Planctomycetota bacterium]
MSPTRFSTQSQKELVEQLTQLVREQVHASQQLSTSFRSREASTQTQFTADADRLTENYQRDREQTETKHQHQINEVRQHYDTESHHLAYLQAELTERSQAKRQEASSGNTEQWEKLCRQAQVMYEREKTGPDQKLAAMQAQCDAGWRTLTSRRDELLQALHRQGSDADEIPTAFEGQLQGAPWDSYREAARRAEQAQALVQHPLCARLSRWPGLILVQLLAMATFFFLLGWLTKRPLTTQLDWPVGLITLGSCVVGVCTAFLYRFMLMPLARIQMLRRYPVFAQACADARTSLDAAIAAVQSQRDEQHAHSTSKRDQALSAANAWRDKNEQGFHDAYQNATQAAAVKFRLRREAALEKRDKSLESLKNTQPLRLQEIEQEFLTTSERLQQRKQARLTASQEVYDEKWKDLEKRWQTGLTGFVSAVDTMNVFCEKQFPPWDSIDWTTWQPPLDPVPAIRFGSYEFSLKLLEGGLPEDPRLQIERTEFTIPAVMSFPDCPSLLLKTPGAGRDQAALALQNVMLRLLTSMPPGKVRYTIIDPVGLGQTFSAFMHLADYDERLVNSRIWTEAAHINQRLTDLTEHMEKVIQTYLRNEFESIQQYNQHAGEIAEPFHILVVANFPANFTEESARRLVSIATSGARCGVYTLLCVDTSLKLPRNFSLADLEEQAATLQWSGQDFFWEDPLLAPLPLTLDHPPLDTDFTAAVKAVGKFAQHANRVEVPFTTVTVPRDSWWQADSRHGLEVPLGRAGATKLQSMRLGSGTSQHVLIAGKTGSGKSTLMHALITNLSIRYAPQEIEFYLIDFKKGVEFKPYATWSLPHARVIAIESEREFGLSVLLRLDEELKRRGNLFREHGVQDIPGFRDACPDTPLPRVLLIVDEFQELFVVDDKIASQASLLLDRLVRQGRAFGIHILLGSQTLAGAYSLARSTLGQMAVRIALQCSEGDSHLILSEENTAARLLGRPGEAIYNDANGLLEGNHPFQIVWLPDHEREDYLQKIGDLARRQGQAPTQTVIFEGNIPAVPARNQLLQEALECATVDPSQLSRTWLGSAVAIKDPTSLQFIRGGGSNLLLVGQHHKLARGTLTTAIVGLLATRPPNPSVIASDDSVAEVPAFYVFDGTPPGEAHSEAWAEFAAHLPVVSRIVTPQETRETIAELDHLAQHRMANPNAQAAPVYIILFDLARFRDLRKEESYSFSSFDEDDSPATDKQFAQLLREGPSQGIHCLIWSDTFNNVQRWLDRQHLRDIEMRVLFPMSPADSSNLMDSPAAAQLGANRAIFYSEQTGTAEKFRPYSLPDDEWLAWVKHQLQQRSDVSSTD